MKTNPEALKALYVAAGGDASAVADAVTSVDVLNKIAVLLGGVGTATTNPDAIDNIAAVYTPGGGGDEPVSQKDLYNSDKFVAYSDGKVLVVGGMFPEVEAAATQQEVFANVKAAKGKTLTKVFEFVPAGFTLAVDSDKVSVKNNVGTAGTPFIVGIYTIS
jgi:hypothetical protein